MSYRNNADIVDFFQQNPILILLAAHGSSPTSSLKLQELGVSIKDFKRNLSSNLLGTL